MDFTFDQQVPVLQEALRLADYNTVCKGVLAITDASDRPAATRQAIGRLGERMATFNGGQPDAHMILRSIATMAWEDAGISGVPALSAADRAELIGVVMAVSKGVISAEATRLVSLAEADTALPEGWAGEAGGSA